MEIAGLPADMDHVNLEAKAVEIFSNIGCDIDSEYIDAYHRISWTSKNVEFKFSLLKNCRKVFSMKKKISKRQ